MSEVKGGWVGGVHDKYERAKPDLVFAPHSSAHSSNICRYVYVDKNIYVAVPGMSSYAHACLVRQAAVLPLCYCTHTLL